MKEEILRYKTVEREIDILSATIEKKILEGESQNLIPGTALFGTVMAMKDMKSNLLVLKEKLKGYRIEVETKWKR